MKKKWPNLEIKLLKVKHMSRPKKLLTLAHQSPVRNWCVQARVASTPFENQFNKEGKW